MISKKKKILILAGMVVLLAVTGVLNVYLNANAGNDIETGGVVYTSFFDSFRAERTATRDQSIIYLDSIIDNPASSEQSIAEAQSMKIEIVKNMNVENKLEQQIKALGYSEVAITSSTQKVTIIIKAEDLTDVEVAQILQLTLTESDKTATDVRVLPVS